MTLLPFFSVHTFSERHSINGLVKDCSNSIVDALELLQSYNKMNWL